MAWRCSVCGTVLEEDDVKRYIEHTHRHIIDAIKKKNPDWVEDDGVCPKCWDYFRSQMRPYKGGGSQEDGRTA